MASDGQTVAFDSIDGPPPQVFDRMVDVLDSEGKLRNLAIVSREGRAVYRVRGYLAAQVAHGRTTIAWVWDVYDSDQKRALRLSGEEPAGKAGRDPWSAADELVLCKIAQAGLNGLSGMVNGTSQEAAQPPSPAPAGPGRVVASTEPPLPLRAATATSRSVTSGLSEIADRKGIFGRENRTGGLPAALTP